MSRVFQRRVSAAALSIAAFVAPPCLAEELAIAESEAERRANAATAAAGKGDPLLNDAPWTTESIRVTARGTANDWPSALATDVVTHDDAIAAPADFQDLITRVPGVGATGQNGIFETFSIRGSGANGILILVGGRPITAQGPA
ncbi:MAG TPA: TonB-dependent receptor plug domain-containing protein, partial [Dokdonella sp.]|nr:TonB-dependent receptor plug domain-containing protein [Dokdonella sp.]